MTRKSAERTGTHNAAVLEESRDILFRSRFPPEGGLRQNPKRCDQAKRTAAFLRYAMKPKPQKPRSIIAQVDGSGTAAT